MAILRVLLKILPFLSPVTAAVAPLCPGGIYGAAASLVAGHGPATSFCASKYPLAALTTTSTSFTIATLTVATVTPTSTLATTTVIDVALAATSTSTTTTTVIILTDTVSTSTTTQTSTKPTMTATAEATAVSTLVVYTTTVNYAPPARLARRLPAKVDPKAVALSNLLKQASSFVKTVCACVQVQKTTGTVFTSTSTSTVTATSVQAATLIITSMTTPTITETYTATSLSTSVTTTRIVQELDTELVDPPAPTEVTTTTTTTSTVTVAAASTCAASAPTYCPLTDKCEAPTNDRTRCGVCGTFTTCTDDDTCVDGVCKFRGLLCEKQSDCYTINGYNRCACGNLLSGRKACIPYSAYVPNMCSNSQQCANDEVCGSFPKACFYLPTEEECRRIQR